MGNIVVFPRGTFPEELSYVNSQGRHERGIFFPKDDKVCLRYTPLTLGSPIDWRVDYGSRGLRIGGLYPTNLEGDSKAIAEWRESFVQKCLSVKISPPEVIPPDTGDPIGPKL